MERVKNERKEKNDEKYFCFLSEENTGKAAQGENRQKNDVDRNKIR